MYQSTAKIDPRLQQQASVGAYADAQPPSDSLTSCEKILSDCFKYVEQLECARDGLCGGGNLRELSPRGDQPVPAGAIARLRLSLVGLNSRLASLAQDFGSAL